MSPVVIASIVEGHGEVEAVPVLIRRVAAHIAPEVGVAVPRPHRRPRSRIVRVQALEDDCRLALAESPGAHLLVLLDADDDCPAELGPRLLERVSATKPPREAVVVAKCEFEAWFLASAESLGGCRGLRAELEAPEDPESVRDAKGWIQGNRVDGRAYSPPVDQAALADGIDIELARRRSGSFDKLCRVLEGWLLGAR
ncbi:MAG: DUF4276 family protein [bacterium]|nr:DUF4276 family protein [bacterium]